MAKFSQAFLQGLLNPSYQQGLFEAAKGLGQTPGLMRMERQRKEEEARKQQTARLVASGQQMEDQAKALAAQRRKDLLTKQAIQLAQRDGDTASLQAIGLGALDPAEYLKSRATSKGEEGFTLPAGSIRYDSEGNVIARAPFKPTEAKAPKIDIKESNGEFVVFENGIEVRRYDTAQKAIDAQNELRKISQTITKAQGVQLKIDDALEMISSNQNVGGWKQLLKFLPDTQARRFEGLITSVKANVGFDQLLAIKAGGSTLGQVSNIENLLLQSTIDSLDTLQGKEDLVTALNRIDAYYESLIAKTKFGENASLKEWAGTVEWTNPEFARMYEQSGGEIVVNEQEGTILVKSPNGETVKLLVNK